MHHLDLLLDEDVGQVDRGVGDGVLDDLVGEAVAGLVESVPLEPLRDLLAEVGEVLKSPIERAKSSSASGRIFSRSSRSSTSKWACWPASVSSP